MWRIVKRCPRIEVNEHGEIRYRDTGKIASTSVAVTGYIQVGIWYQGRTHTYNVHRLVAEAFIPNPYNLPQINHKDEDRANCNVENLEWCTQKYNNNYGTHKEKQRRHCCKPVVAIDKETKKETMFFSIAEAGRVLGVNPGNISRALNGRRKGTLSHFWKYAEEVIA